MQACLPRVEDEAQRFAYLRHWTAYAGLGLRQARSAGRTLLPPRHAIDGVVGVCLDHELDGTNVSGIQIAPAQQGQLPRSVAILTYPMNLIRKSRMASLLWDACLTVTPTRFSVLTGTQFGVWLADEQDLPEE